MIYTCQKVSKSIRSIRLCVVVLQRQKLKETRKVKDINHKISKQIVQFAKDNKCDIKLENLTGIRNSNKNNRTFRYTLNY
jgi:putative transposase